MESRLTSQTPGGLRSSRWKDRQVWPHLASWRDWSTPYDYDQASVERVFSMVNKIDTKFRPSLGNTTVCALRMSKINSEVPCPQLNVSEQLLVTLKLLQVNATMTCELREKKQLPTTMLQSRWEWWRVELVTRTSAFIHYVMLLHKYIELPILYKYFDIFLLWIWNQVLWKCLFKKRGHRIAQIAAFAI